MAKPSGRDLTLSGPSLTSDLRLAIAGVLIASNGDVVGKATVLSPDVAVTTAEVAISARTKVAALGSAPAVSFGPLGLVFPQFQKSPGVYPLTVKIAAIDSERGFGVLQFSGMLPAPVPPGLLGTGEIPADGTECDVLYSDGSRESFFHLSGLLESQAAPTWFKLHLNGDLPAVRWPLPLAGAPVFNGRRFVGIVTKGPLRELDSSVSKPYLVEVLSVGGMAESELTPIVRNLLPWQRPEAKPPTLPTSIAMAR